MSPSESRSVSPLAAALLLTISSACWGGNIFIGRAVHAEVPPVGLSFWRWALALMILLPFAWPKLRRDWGTILRQWKSLAALAFFGMVAFHTALYLSVNYTTATNAALLVAICPVLVPVLSWALYREPIAGRILLATLISLGGVAVVILRGDPAQLATLTFNTGDLVMLVAVFAWSMYTVLVRRRPAALHPQSLLVATMAFATAMLLPLYLWESAFVRPMPVSPDSMLAVAYVVVFASLLAFLCFNRGIEVLGPNKGGLFLHLIPVFAALLAFVLLGERLQLYHGVGIAAIAAGIALATTAKQRPR
ncbi:MAG: DMT family transporter [Kiloniellaceae bacterium]